MSPKPNFLFPICGGANECVPAHTGKFDAPCWCATVTVDSAAIASLPHALRNQCAHSSRQHSATATSPRARWPDVQRDRCRVRLPTEKTTVACCAHAA